MRLGTDELPQVETYSTGGLDSTLHWVSAACQRAHRRDLRAESSGKTTIALQTIAQCQKNGGVAAFIDAEHALDLTTQRPWASVQMNSWFPSPIVASRRSRSQRPWSGLVPSTWW